MKIKKNEVTILSFKTTMIRCWEFIELKLRYLQSLLSSH